jgi:hypothetical protein
MSSTCCSGSSLAVAAIISSSVLTQQKYSIRRGPVQPSNCVGYEPCDDANPDYEYDRLRRTDWLQQEAAEVTSSVAIFSPTDVPTACGLKQVNPKHQLTWTMNLPAGGEEKLTYTYQLYVRP